MPFLGSVHFPLPQSQGGLLGRWQVASGISAPNPTPPPPAGSLYYKHWICRAGGGGAGKPCPSPLPASVHSVQRGARLACVATAPLFPPVRMRY